MRASSEGGFLTGFPEFRLQNPSKAELRLALNLPRPQVGLSDRPRPSCVSDKGILRVAVADKLLHRKRHNRDVSVVALPDNFFLFDVSKLFLRR